SLSSEARSVGSAYPSSVPLFISPTARSASLRISCFRSSRILRKSLRSRCLITLGSALSRVFDSIGALIPCKARSHENRVSRCVLGPRRRHDGRRADRLRARFRKPDARPRLPAAERLSPYAEPSRDERNLPGEIG